MTVRKPGPQGRDLLDRLSDKFLVGDRCWDWVASKDRQGYGRFGTWINGRRVGTGLAHRVVYELLVGPIQLGLTLDHLCRNRACVRPDHLEPVPSAVNKSRQVSANRQKTHCPRGHPYDGDNLYLDSHGGRYCKACWRVRYWDGRVPHTLKTHCLRGHPFDEENTYFRKNGGRGCRACIRARSAAYKLRLQREQRK